MADGTAIQWSQATLNVVTGCTRVSEGCDRCYIERTPPFRMAGRKFDRPGVGGTTGVQLHPERLQQALRWQRPRRIFMPSLGDLFHEDVPDSLIAEAWEVMARADPMREPARLRIVPSTIRAARRYVDQHHRHHRAPVGGLLAAAVADQHGGVRGVVLVGRPVARHYQDGVTAEVTRCCTDGTPHACSMLYGAAWRAAKALGYRRLITYTQAGEPGSSLRGAGWQVVAERAPHAGWDRPSRPRTDHGSAGVGRTLWEAS